MKFSDFDKLIILKQEITERNSEDEQFRKDVMIYKKRIESMTYEELLQERKKYEN